MKAKIKDTKHLNIPGNDDLSSNRETLTAFLKQFRQKLGYYSIFAALPAILTSFAQDARAEDATITEIPVAGRSTHLLERLNKIRSTPKLLRRQSSFLLPHQKRENTISALAGGDNCPGTAIPGGTYTAAAPYTDSSSTTGANNTVNLFYGYYYYSYNANGPDQIYSFTLTERGPNPQIQVSATSADYQPMIYILVFGGCPAGTNNFANNLFGQSYASSPGGTATYNLEYIPSNVPLYLFVDSEKVGANDSGPYTLRLQDVTIAPATPPRTKFDFDGDGRADISVFRPSNGFWYLNRSSEYFAATQFGLSTDKLTPADFDGDQTTDIAVFRDGIWYWINSSTRTFQTAQTAQFGQAGDIPVPFDYTGDGRAEIAVYRNGTWYSLDLSNNQLNATQFGNATDKPVPSDYDGDGKTDIAVVRQSGGVSIWYIFGSTQGIYGFQFGTDTDKPVPADYDGDGKTDIAVYRDGTWYVLQSGQGFTAFQFGNATDIPAPADYDGDGRVDAAVYRDGIWYLRQSTNGFAAQQFGLATDKPVPTAFLP